MSLIKDLLRQTEKIDFLFPNSFEELMNNDYYNYDQFEWFLYYVFKMSDSTASVEKIGKKGKGDGGADLILTVPHNDGVRRIGIQAKYWKNRVGTEPINQLASAKSRHNLTDLWLITTSDLTSDAREIAEVMHIKVLRGDDVANFISLVKKKYEEDMSRDGTSSIEFLKPVKLKRKPNQHDESLSNEETQSSNYVDYELVKKLKRLRAEIAQKHNLFPLYNVFTNEVIYALINEKPSNKEELMRIKGLGEIKVEKFGQDLLNFVATNLLINKELPAESSKNLLEKELTEFLLAERVKIAKFNKMSEENVYSDKVTGYLAKMKPRTKEVLSKVYGFPKDNINIFGEYLVKVISKFLDARKEEER